MKVSAFVLQNPETKEFADGKGNMTPHIQHAMFLYHEPISIDGMEPVKVTIEWDDDNA